MKPTTTSQHTAEQRAEEEAVRRQHAANPIRQRPAAAINRQSFTAILSLLARFKTVRESQGLTLVEVAERMGIVPPALSRLETGKMLNPTLATLQMGGGARAEAGGGFVARLTADAWRVDPAIRLGGTTFFLLR